MKFQQQVEKVLEEAGCSVFRSAGSKGPADLLALGGCGLVLVQCKTTGWVSREDRGILRQLGETYNCDPVLAYMPKVGKKRRAGVAFRFLGDDRTEDWKWTP